METRLDTQTPSVFMEVDLEDNLTVKKVQYPVKDNPKTKTNNLHGQNHLVISTLCNTAEIMSVFAVYVTL